MNPPFPISDHCDGRRFFNPHGPQARSFRDLPKWRWQQMRGSVTPWPKNPPPPQAVRLPASVSSGSVAVTFVGHATFLLQFPDFTVLTDPVFGQRAGPFGLLGPVRARPPALSLAQLPAIDVVLLSHNHYDHLDLGSLRWLARERHPQIVVPLGLKSWLQRRNVDHVVELDWWQKHSAVSGLEIHCAPAQHWSSRTPWDRTRTLWGGFFLRTPHGSVYFAGDSGWGPHFAEIKERVGAPDLALLPIGAYEPRWFMESVHMNPDEAVRAHLALEARRSVGMHFGTFQLTDEGIDAPLHDLAVARSAHGMAEEEFRVPEFGETISVELI
jgi:L-ascorbate metabolism protein UlaG (beta-lactamase superfamily)